MNDWITPNWPAPLNVQALFTTRSGGINSGPYTNFNLGDHVGDKKHIVHQNRAKLLNALPSEPRWLNQVHGSTPIWVDNNTSLLRGDAALSKTQNIVCAILTADCLPVFLCDEAGTVVGIVHAGWRGLVAGVIEQAVAEMRKSCIHIMAYLGPAIGPDYFEIGEIQRYPNNEVWIYDSAGNLVFNVKGYTNDWQGTVNGNPLPKASYLYRVDADSNGTPDYQGWIYLTR